jgi:hypothetical protein
VAISNTIAVGVLVCERAAAWNEDLREPPAFWEADNGASHATRLEYEELVVFGEEVPQNTVHSASLATDTCPVFQERGPLLPHALVIEVCGIARTDDRKSANVNAEIVVDPALETISAPAEPVETASQRDCGVTQSRRGAILCHCYGLARRCLEGRIGRHCASVQNLEMVAGGQVPADQSIKLARLASHASAVLM